MNSLNGIQFSYMQSFLFFLRFLQELQIESVQAEDQARAKVENQGLAATIHTRIAKNWATS